MKFLSLILTLSILLPVSIFGQDNYEEWSCSHVKSRNKSFNRNGSAQLMVAHPDENVYDIHYMHIDISASNNNITLNGNATIKAKVQSPGGMSQYVFELNDGYIIDSIKINGVNRTFSRLNNVVFTSMDSPLPDNSSFTAKVYYRGSATSTSDGYDVGIYNQSSITWGNKITYTVSQPFGARGWFPAKQSLMDKIDSAKIWITVADTLLAGSNGVLEQVTVLPANKKRYEWKTQYPIDYYLLSIAISDYVEYNIKALLPNSGDSVLIQNYIYDNGGTLPFWKDAIDSVALMMTYFSQLYGDYPFKDEKYGHCMAPFAGGMEHQTMTTQYGFPVELTTHELAHQWFGNNVTCATWGDIWLNEGFASYSEYLFINQYHGSAAGVEKMQSAHNSVMSAPGGTVYCYDSTNEDRIFSSRLSYKKGSSIAHTLRFVVNNDSLFFAMLRGYMDEFRSGNATTEMFKNYCEAFTGIDLDVFMDQWIYKEGYPTFNLAWNQSGAMNVFKLSQTTSVPSSVAFFKTPIEIKFISTSGVDTTIRVNHNVNGELFHFNWNHAIDQVIVDPNNWILNKTQSIAKDGTLPLSIDDNNMQSVNVTPNPSSDIWNITGINSSSHILLYNNEGKLIKSYNDVKKNLTIENKELASGIYHVVIVDEDAHRHTIKVVKL